jgi:hypothetical protein
MRARRAPWATAIHPAPYTNFVLLNIRSSVPRLRCSFQDLKRIPA